MTCSQLSAYLYVQAVDVCNGVNCDRPQAKLFAGPYHAHRNLATVCYEDFRKFCSDHMLAALWPRRTPLQLDGRS